MAKILAPFLLDCIVVFVFVLSIGFYIQANFLNGSMKSLQGQMDRLLEENPDFLKPLDGFTYYPNCTSVHSRTYPSVPYILTGEKCFFDKTPEEYVDVAYEESEFWNTLTRYNVNIGLYTRGDFIGEKAKNSIVNYYNGKPHFDKIKIFLQTIKMTMYRDMPYCFKRYFHYEASDIASAVIENDEQPEAFQYFNDEWLSNCISSNGLSIETGEQNKTFRFIHFGAYHLGWTLDSCKNAFYAVYDYIDQMKKMGYMMRQLLL